MQIDVLDVFWTSYVRLICVYGGGQCIKGNEWCLAEAVITQTCFTKKSSVILGKLTGKHLWWPLFSGFRSATLVKKILINKPFSVNGCKHLWASASESNFRISTILFVLLYIRYKVRLKRFKGVPLITSSSEPPTATSNASISWHFLVKFLSVS